MIKKIQGVIVLCATIPLGIVAMCYGRIFSSLLSLVWNTYYTRKLIGYGYWAQMRDLLHILVHALVMGVIVWSVVQWLDSLWMQLVIGILVGAAYYMTGAMLMRFEEFGELVALVRKKRNN